MHGKGQVSVFQILLPLHVRAHHYSEELILERTVMVKDGMRPRMRKGCDGAGAGYSKLGWRDGCKRHHDVGL